MSKLLPKIKKKLKGKEEEIVHELRKKGKEEEDHESKKKRVKATKSHKETSPLIGGPLSSSKHDKKRKAGKSKPSNDRERPKEFFVDGGIVREDSAGLYVDENGALREGPGDQFTDLTLEDDHGKRQASVKMVDILEASYREGFEAETQDPQADQSLRSEYSTLDFDVDGFRVDSPHDDGESLADEVVSVESEEAVCESDKSHVKEESSGDNIDSLKDKQSQNNDVRTDQSESYAPAPSDSVMEAESVNSTENTNDNCKSEVTVCQDEQETVRVQDEEVGQEHIPAQNFVEGDLNIPDTNLEDAEAGDRISSGIPSEATKDSVHLSRNKDVEESEDVAGERLVEDEEDAKIGKVEEGVASESEEAEKGDEEDNGSSDQQILEEVSSPTSQDSDDDFDSAQEDWDDDEHGGRPQSPGIHSFGENETPQGESDDAEVELIETTNTCIVGGQEEKDDEQDSRGFSTSSSNYQDAAMSRENSETLDISSLVEAVNGELEPEEDGSLEGKKASSQHGKLTRKTSNISVASSDVFDEELDELLDEELDRLSEVEEAEAVHVKEIPATGTEAVSDHKDSVSSSDDLVKDKEIVEANSSQSEERTQQEIEIGIPKTKVDDIVPSASAPSTDMVKTDTTSIPSLSEQPLLNNDAKSSTKEDHSVNEDIAATVTDNYDSTPPEHETGIASPVVDNEAGNSQEDKGQKADGVKTSLLSPEDPPEETKDSGYYSLPVSPAVARGSDPPSSTPINPDDSFGDSEEDGMVTPPSEVAVSPAENSVPSEAVASSRDEDSSSDEDTTSEAKTIEESPALEKEEDLQTPEQEEKASVLGENEKKVVEESKTNGEEILPKLKIPKHPIAFDLKDGGASPRSGSSTPTHHPRHKTSVSGNDHRHHRDEGALSPDRVGEMFLQQAVCQSHEEAEARLAQRRAARAEARELRLRELEKQQHEQDNDDDKLPSTPQAYPEPGGARLGGGGRTGAVGRGSGVNCIAGGQYSRRSSEDSTTDESLPANVREMRAELKELDEKFRKAMITNAQLDNEKATLTFEVELMKDRYTELEETHTQLTKEHRRKCTEYEQLRKVSTKLQEEVKILRGLLQERDQLIQEYGLVVVGEEENGEDGDIDREEEEDDVEDLSPRKILVKKALISQEAADLLSKGAAQGSLDVRLKKFGEEKNDLEDQVRRLKLELEEERSKNRRRENGLDYEKQKEQSKTVNEYKFRVQKAEAEVSTLQANVARLDALSARYKSQSEELERSEEELKMEKRKLQRELRDAQSRLEELETTNNHLIKRFDKLKNARSNLLKDLSQDPA